MENLNINNSEITWERKSANNENVLYKNTILKHDDHISVIKTMFVDGQYKQSDLTSIPMVIFDEIKKLK